MKSPARQKLAGEPAPRSRPERSALLVELIAVGRDLLRGRVADDNSRYLADFFARRGGRVRRITVLDDHQPTLAAALREALERDPNLVVLTGGLGAADDDVTVAAVAESLGRPLAAHPGAKSMVEQAFVRLHRAGLTRTAGMNRRREKLFQLPVGAEAVANELGVAPGVLLRMAGGSAVLCLPGLPREMRAVLDAAVALIDAPWPRTHLARRDVEAPLADESELRPLLEQLREEHPELWISSRPTVGKSGPKVYVTLEATSASAEGAEAAIHTAVRRLLALATGGG